MKHFFLVVLMLCAQIIFANNNTFDALVKVNAQWLNQDDINKNALQNYDATKHQEWIKIHLKLVEQKLRMRSTAHLNLIQKNNRQLALAHLNAYWQSEKFPINDKLNYTTPIFIDQHDNFCAVGYLVKATGFESISRKIAANSNLAYVKEMNYPELNQWANDFGFTVDELAWIQPGYYPNPPNPPTLFTLDNGVNGTVDAMCPDANSGRIYFGGDFQTLSNGLMAKNIGYFKKVDNDEFEFQTLADGLNGQVLALTMLGNKLVAAGHFSASGTSSLQNVAIWNDTTWQALGCLDGVVKDLLVHDGVLYAVGSFGICGGGNTQYGFAKWSGSEWQVFSEILGNVNKMIVFDSNIVLGGDMFYNTVVRKTLKWNEITGFITFQNDVNQEVTAFGLDGNTLYLGMTASIADVDTSLTFPSSKTGLATINIGDSSWSDFVFSGWVDLNSGTEFPSIKSIIKESQSGVVYVGGKFSISASNQYSIGDFNENSFGIGGPYHVSIHNFFSTNAPVHCFAKLGNDYYMGGAFTVGVNKGLGKMFPQLPTSIPKNELLKFAEIYPNPVTEGCLNVELEFEAKAYGIYDLSGKLIRQQTMNTRHAKIDLHNRSSGVYFLHLIDEKGSKFSRKIIIK